MVKAVGLPRGMAPRPTEINVQNKVAGIGQLRRSLTFEKKGESGVAWSRAKDHHIRPHVRRVPTRQIMREIRTMKRRQNVPPFVPVAWWYISARGKEPLLLTTASKSEME
jgi:hypothetical protein